MSIRIKEYITILVLTIIACTGCSPRAGVSVQTETAPVESAVTYQVQHSGVLDIGGKRFPLRGLIKLQPDQKQARVLLMNDMGIKLLIADLKAGDKKDFEAGALFVSPILQAIPGFYYESLRCIYELYLTDEEPSQNLVITETEPEIIDGHNFYKHTVISNADKNYTLELFLNSAVRTGS